MDQFTAPMHQSAPRTDLFAFQVGSIEGSINIPLEELRDRLDEYNI
ncbi:MAG TPA: hypothetical protein GX392_06155 [Clostridiales bacterium]|nr:hypothetical protein [Clostridiales bacterium]